LDFSFLILLSSFHFHFQSFCTISHHFPKQSATPQNQYQHTPHQRATSKLFFWNPGIWKFSGGPRIQLGRTVECPGDTHGMGYGMNFGRETQPSALGSHSLEFTCDLFGFCNIYVFFWILVLRTHTHTLYLCSYYPPPFPPLS
jgi:hypothetical protein